MSAPNAATHPSPGAEINEAQRPSGALIAAGLAALLMIVYGILRRDALLAALDEMRHAFLLADTYYQMALAVMPRQRSSIWARSSHRAGGSTSWRGW